MNTPIENKGAVYPWYEVIRPGNPKAYEIEQGDILEGFSTLTAIDPDEYPGAGLLLERLDHNLVVLTQSCDLAHGKVNRVVTCPLLTLDEFPENHPVSRKGGLERLRKGTLAAFHLLNRCELGDFERDWRIVDFGEVHSIPLSQVRKHLASSPHLRLLPPYREHLSQSFARFFMRVGLPIDIPEFV